MNDNREAATNSIDSGLAAAVLAYLFWGFVPLYWRLIETPAVQVIPWRFVQVSILTGGFIWLRARRTGHPIRLPVVHLATGLVLGTNWFVFIYAIETERVVDASLGYFINPLVSVALGTVVLGERLRRAQRLAVGLAALGVVALTVDAGQFPWIATVLSLAFGVYGLLRKQSPLEAVEGLAADTIWLAAPALGFITFLGVDGRLVVGTGVSLAAFFLIGAVTALPLVLFAYAARRMTLSMVGLLQYLTPAFQFLLGWLAFGEQISSGRWVGVGFIWAALAVLGFDAGSRHPSIAPGSMDGELVDGEPADGQGFGRRLASRKA